MEGIRTTFIILSSIFPRVAISSSPPWDCDGWDPTEDGEVGGGGGTRKGGLNLFCLTGTAAGAGGGIFFGGMAMANGYCVLLIVGDGMSG